MCCGGLYLEYPPILAIDDLVPNSMAVQAAVQMHGGVHGEDSLVATRTEQVKCCQSLVCLLQSLTGARTTIELRNEITVEGTVTSVDLHMKYIKINTSLRFPFIVLACMVACHNIGSTTVDGILIPKLEWNGMGKFGPKLRSLLSKF